MTITKNSTRNAIMPQRLRLDAAVAARLVREAKIPAPLFAWLSALPRGQACRGPAIDALCDERVTAAINEILQPVLAETSQSEQRQSRYVAEWLSTSCRCAAKHYSELQLGIGPRMLAASLLPMYRCLATGNLAEGLRQTQTRFAEQLTLLALCYELGDDLVELLELRNRRMDSPDLVLSSQMELNLTQVAALMCELATDFDSPSQQFETAAVDRLQRIDAQPSYSAIPAWAAPGLLWKLAGELISKNSELVLPRCWIDTPVPWNNVADHWNKLSHLLSSQTSPSSRLHSTLGNTPERGDTARGDRARINTASSTVEVDPSIGDAATVDASRTGHASLGERPATKPATIDRPANKVLSLDSLPLEMELDDPIPESVTPVDLISEVTRVCDVDEDVTLAAVEQIAAMIKETKVAQVEPAPVLPKVLIAEIRTHNDPIFVNVIRRQIGKCRAEDRAVSLVSMVVLPEDETDRHTVHENGLKMWQQRLVNWLADHPQVVEPYAFLTSEGELLLCLLDLERNETTSLVRHGLVEVLTGQHIDESHGNLLAKVNVPARYHAGIASTSSPGAGFTAEQLIEPAVRCLSAASRHGKASIKSIEVY